MAGDASPLEPPHLTALSPARARSSLITYTKCLRLYVPLSALIARAHYRRPACLACPACLAYPAQRN
ncbi:unnamed protein product [Danaus chrysippus]|uniref:(African queen) hypothetical protein n=1 Tax=Danaus chrysippus TaxID=151541 RepID=A0A8J2VQ93_9NEOP|nr:unnamed protein product [Danaus chrysippus]